MRREEVNERENTAYLRGDGHAGRELPERRPVAPGRIDDRNPRPGLDTEFFDERAGRVTGHAYCTQFPRGSGFGLSTTTR